MRMLIPPSGDMLRVLVWPGADGESHVGRLAPDEAAAAGFWLRQRRRWHCRRGVRSGDGVYGPEQSALSSGTAWGDACSQHCTVPGCLSYRFRNHVGKSPPGW